MAATPTNSSLNNSLLQKLNPKLSHCYQISYSTINLPKRRRMISHQACNNISSCNCSNSNQTSSNSVSGKGKKKSNSVKMQKLLEDENPYQLTSKNSSSISLPRPLTSASLSNLASEGTCLRVAYQGERGAYCELVAEKAYQNCEAVRCEQFDTAFDAVERWLVDRAVLPIKNSLGRSIHRNYDLLLHNRLHIVGEVKIAIQHCLLANRDVELEELKRVLSHPQCENTLTKLGLVREAIDDTASAAKTSIVFSLEECPGELFKVLAVFAIRKINLTKIESRPLQKQALQALVDNAKNFPYLFYVDFEASMADERAQNALSQLKEFVAFLRVLGSYPADTGMP